MRSFRAKRIYRIATETHNEHIGTPRPEKSTAKPKPTQTPEKQQKACTAPSVKISGGRPDGIAWRERKDGSLESVFPKLSEFDDLRGRFVFYRTVEVVSPFSEFCYECFIGDVCD